MWAAAELMRRPECGPWGVHSSRSILRAPLVPSASPPKLKSERKTWERSSARLVRHSCQICGIIITVRMAPAAVWAVWAGRQPKWRLGWDGFASAARGSGQAALAGWRSLAPTAKDAEQIDDCSAGRHGAAEVRSGQRVGRSRAWSATGTAAAAGNSPLLGARGAQARRQRHVQLALVQWRQWERGCERLAALVPQGGEAQRGKRTAQPLYNEADSAMRNATSHCDVARAALGRRRRHPPPAAASRPNDVQWITCQRSLHAIRMQPTKGTSNACGARPSEGARLCGKRWRGASGADNCVERTAFASMAIK